MRLAKGEVHVWKVRLEATALAASGPALRRILSMYTGRAAAALRFRRGRHGKPSLATPRAQGLHFNLSHSREVMLIAVSRSYRVGVDVEHVRTIDELLLSRSWFSMQEQRQLEALPPARRRQAFFHTWTRKEAYIKARGLGLAMPLDRFTVSVHPRQAALLSVRGRRPRRWDLRRIEAGPACAAALVSSGRPTRIRVRSLR